MLEVWKGSLTHEHSDMSPNAHGKMANKCCPLLTDIDLLLKASALSLSKITVASSKHQIKILIMIDFCSSLFYRSVKPYFICLKNNS